VNDSAQTILINSILQDIKNINIKINTLTVQVYEDHEVLKSMLKLIMESTEVKEEDARTKTDS